MDSSSSMTQSEYRIDEDIPFSRQEDNYSCVAHCTKMVIDHFSNKDDFIIHSLSLDEIKKKIDTTQEMATAYENVSNLNDDYKGTSPSLTFHPADNFTWDDLLRELKEKRPVIAWIKENPEYELAHSVVVKEFDPKTDTVTYLDPVEGAKTVYVGDFMEQWENAFNILIPVTVGDLFQKKLTEDMQGDEAQ